MNIAQSQIKTKIYEKAIHEKGLQLDVTNLKPNEVYTIIVEDNKGLKLNGKIIKL